MKKRACFKIVALVLVIISLVTGISIAFAASSTEHRNNVLNGDTELRAQLNSLPPFKFKIHSSGIGYGSCPVYTAPSMDSYRCANGNATCQTNAKMDDGGYVNGWLMVRYATNNGGVRVGYIPPNYIRGFESQMYPHFGYIPAVAEDIIMVTDNPMMHGTSFAQMDPGEEFHILSTYDYYAKDGLEWWYIECTVDDKLAYGFIEKYDSSFRLGN